MKRALLWSDDRVVLRWNAIGHEWEAPTGAIKQPTLAARLGLWLLDNLVYGLWLVTVVVCLAVWYRRGRDLPGLGSISVQYEPPAELTDFHSALPAVRKALYEGPNRAGYFDGIYDAPPQWKDFQSILSPAPTPSPAWPS